MTLMFEADEALMESNITVHGAANEYYTARKSRRQQLNDFNTETCLIWQTVSSALSSSSILTGNVLENMIL